MSGVICVCGSVPYGTIPCHRPAPDRLRDLLTDLRGENLTAHSGTGGDEEDHLQYGILVHVGEDYLLLRFMDEEADPRPLAWIMTAVPLGSLRGVEWLERTEERLQ
ncbi:MAG: hypothetical protein OXD34_08355 [bacterium]|nr:hypothetical protein [bacterium]